MLGGSRGDAASRERLMRTNDHRPAGDLRPAGWSYNPSTWSERVPIVVLALGGFAIASYLALYQLRLISGVWEPFFGSGSERIDEFLASLQHLKACRTRGASVWRAFWGLEACGHAS
jgi:hypothetical protein